MSFDANSAKVKLSLGFLEQVKVPWVNSISSGLTSQSKEARSLICLSTSCAARMAALPVSTAMRLPPVAPVQPTESVSTTLGLTSSAFIPRISAACMAIDVRLPPMSTEPVMRLIVPFALTFIVAEDPLPPPFNR